jgi:UDP-2-acetamido-2-deoxy-ribo-hexuluronate aminotransferase
MSIAFTDLATQYQHLKQAIDARIQQVLDHGQYILGPEVAELEEKLATYVGVKHAVGVSDGTTALQMALMALNIGSGDEVITTPLTFISTAETIVLLGAKPVFVDIDPVNYNIDSSHIEAAITPKTKAIMAVNLYGQCADFDAIQNIAKKYQLPVIEDAAQSFGAQYKGKKSCSLATISCTSFYPAKPLGCYGDGGMCFTQDNQLAEGLRKIRVHGQSERYCHSILGINGRLDTLQAAILLAKLPTFEQEIMVRQQVAKNYDDLLKGFVTIPKIAPDCLSAYAQYTIQVKDRLRVQTALKKQGIPTAVHYPIPLYQQPALSIAKESSYAFVHTEKVSATVLSLPMHPFLDVATQQYIAEAIKSML